MAYLRVIGKQQADGDLLAAYQEMDSRQRPAAYQPAHGDAAGIVRAHSLDPELMRRTFAASGSLNSGELAWDTQELVNAVTARENECFY